MAEVSLVYPRAISRIDRGEEEESSGDLEDEGNPASGPEDRKAQEQSLSSKQVEFWGIQTALI